MKKVFLALTLIGVLCSLSYADIKLNARAAMDYKAKLNTNSAVSDFSDFSFQQANISINGNISPNIYGKFTVDFSANASTYVSTLFGATHGASIWAAYFDVKLAEELVLSAGIMDSVFGWATPLRMNLPKIDAGFKISGKLAGGLLGYAVQLLDGNSSMISDYSSLTRTTAYMPSVQALISLMPVKGLGIGLACKYDNFISTPNSITNTEIGVEASLNVTKDLIPNLSLMADFGYCMNSYPVNTTNTNLSGMYFYANLGYSLGSIVPRLVFNYWDPNNHTAVTNNENMVFTAQATFFLDDAKFVAITPRVDFNLISGGSSTPANNLTLRCRFDYQFDTTIVKTEAAPTK